MGRLYYFAYGSNMHPRRLSLRVPSSQALGIAQLPAHQLHFHKRGADASGKCNVFYTGDGSNSVIGVVYTMNAAEKPLLDKAEGLGKGYTIASYNAVVANKECEMFFYQAETAHIDNKLQPFTWYHRLVIAGAKFHGLPDHYITTIEQVSAWPDPDTNREALHLQILHSTVKL